MATSAVPDAIDALVALIQATDSTLQVNDGWSIEQSSSMVLVGVTDQTPTTPITHSWAGLGAQRQDEEFSIPCVVWCASGSATQKTVRDQAFTILNNIETALLASSTSRTLNGALTPPGIAEITVGGLDQTNSTEQAGEGRFARIYFTVHCTSRLTA
jgi:hypothetical protein